MNQEGAGTCVCRHHDSKKNAKIKTFQFQECSGNISFGFQGGMFGCPDVCQKPFIENIM